MLALNLSITIVLSVLLLILIGFLVKEKKLFIKYTTIFYIPLTVTMFVLYYYGLDSNGVVDRIFTSLKNSLGAIFFDNKFDDLIETFQQDNWYAINYYINLVFFAFITFSMVIDLFFRQVFNFFKSNLVRNDLIVVLVEKDDDEVRTFLNSTKNALVVIFERDKDFEKYLLNKNISFKNGLSSKFIEKLTRNKTVKFISFFKTQKNRFYALDQFKKIENTCYLEIDNEYSYAFEEMTSDTSNIILFNKYNLIADDFMIDHSISKYLTDKDIDRKTLALKEGVDVNMFMIGFGKVNQALFLELIKNNQYAINKNGKFKPYKVKYTIFNDKKIASSNYNHKLGRIDSVDYSKKEYYEEIDHSYEYITKDCDINSKNFYSEIRNNLNNNGLNVFIVSLGDDIKNIDIALKLNDRINSWELDSRHLIFVRTKIDETLDYNLPEEIITFGSDKQVLSKDTIVNDRLLKLAKERNALYAHSKDIEGSWKKLSLARRIANKNSVAGFIHKLGLLGLEISGTDKGSIDEKQYMEIYDRDKEITRDKDNNIIYPLHFSTSLNPRNALAFVEHSRWVNDMLTKGFIPMKKSMMKIIEVEQKDGNGKLVKVKVVKKDDQDLKLHTCITTFEGLDNYFDDAAKMLSKARNISYDEAYKVVENKCYDYEIMDQAHYLLRSINRYIKHIE